MITACENVCRDFYWLASFDPRVVQGLFTFTAALIASFTALHIAKKVYPIQKDKDRDIKIDEEKRSVYRDYLKSVDLIVNQRLYESQNDKLKAFADCKSALNEVLIFADQKTAAAMWALYKSASILANKMSEKHETDDVSVDEFSDVIWAANRDFQGAVNAARNELNGEDLGFKLDLAILASKRS